MFITMFVYFPQQQDFEQAFTALLSSFIHSSNKNDHLKDYV